MSQSAVCRAYVYLGADALSSLIHGVLPVILPMWLLGGMQPNQYATLLMIDGIAQLITAPLLSPASDRYGPAKVLLGGEFCFAILLGAAVYLVSGGITSTLGWIPYFLASGVIKGILFPAQATIIQRITPADSLERMLGWEAIALTFGRLTGPTVAALALTSWTPSQALGWVSASWLLAWLIQIVVLFDLARTPEAGQGQKDVNSPPTIAGAGRVWLNAVRSGGRLRFNLLTERWLLFQAAGELLFVVPAFGFGLALAIHGSSWPISSLGWAQAACGAGILLANFSGEAICGRFDRWLVGQVSGYGIGVGLFGMAVALDAQHLLGFCCMGLLSNFSLGIRIYCGRAQRRMALPRELQARFAAIHGVANTLAAQTGNALAAIVCQSTSASGWYFLAGAAIVPLTFATRWIPAWRELLALNVEEANGFYRRRWPAVLGTSD